MCLGEPRPEATRGLVIAHALLCTSVPLPPRYPSIHSHLSSSGYTPGGDTARNHPLVGLRVHALKCPPAPSWHLQLVTIVTCLMYLLIHQVHSMHIQCLSPPPAENPMKAGTGLSSLGAPRVSHEPPTKWVLQLQGSCWQLQTQVICNQHLVTGHRGQIGRVLRGQVASERAELLGPGRRHEGRRGRT